MPHTRIGTDLVEVATVAESIERFGSRYLQRIYTPDELAYCDAGGAERVLRLAARFAAKEACIKVLRPADGGIAWHWIEVVKMPGGWCELALHGGAARLAEASGIRHLSVSLSHERHYAVAVVAATMAD